MHPTQQEFLDAIAAWDRPAVHAALVHFAEALGGFTANDTTREELRWLSYTLIDEHGGYPGVGTGAQITQGGFAILVQHRSDATPNSVEPRQFAWVEYYIGLSLLDAPSAVLHRWRTMGFCDKPVRIPRDRIKTPGSFVGEPRFREWPTSYAHHQPPNPGAAPEHTYRHACEIAERARSTPMLDRYVAGERQTVWDELVEMGNAARDPAVIGDAAAVARLTMRRAAANVRTLHQRLLGSGYVFESDPPPLSPPASDVLVHIHDFERRVGPIPLALAACFEFVGQVWFLGHHPDHPKGDAYPDPLAITDARYALEQGGWDRYRWYVALSPDFYHKEEVSGGGPYGVSVPNAAADAIFEGEPHNETLVAYLRRVFAAGGFPNWRGEPTCPDAWLSELADGLEPI